MLAIYVLLSVAVCRVDSGRVLAVFPFIGKSHFFVFQSVLEQLAKRGHDVTVVGTFPRKTPLPGYKDVDVSSAWSEPFIVDLDEFEKTGFTAENAMKELRESTLSYERVFNATNFVELMNSSLSFDAVLTEIFISDMFVGVAHRFQAPLVEMISSVPVPWASDRFAYPDNPSYIRNYFDSGAGPMSLYERIVNTVSLVLFKSFYSFFVTSNDERVSKQYLGKDIPHVEEMKKNTSLFLVNSHYSITGARPYPPQVVEVGGVHIKQAKPIPQEIESFINESEHGVVYFSLGSIANISSMSDSMRQSFINSFAKLKQRVLWKWELDEMPGKPENVKIVKWMPQGDVLAHPKVKVFIGHGGLLGTMEGVHNAVPMIGIPLFADQYQNIANLVNAGTAVLLDFATITEATLTEALHKVLDDPNYKKNAERLSQLFRDRPASPLDTAVFWIEYVMRHKGAHHLRSAAVDLPWYQYLLLDVIAFLLAILVLVVVIVTKTVKFLLRRFCATKKQKIN